MNLLIKNKINKLFQDNVSNTKFTTYNNIKKKTNILIEKNKSYLLRILIIKTKKLEIKNYPCVVLNIKRKNYDQKIKVVFLRRTSNMYVSFLLHSPYMFIYNV